MLNLNQFTSKDGRTITKGMLVGVHVNSHKNCLSIVSMNSRHNTGLVLGYAQNVTLKDVTTHIDKSKQKKVIESGKKDRHAFLVGYIEDFEAIQLENPVFYRPQDVKDFVDATSYFKSGQVNYLGSVERANLQVCKDSGKPNVSYKSWENMQQAN